MFPPAWAVLYLTIAVSGWLVWRKVGFAGDVLPLSIYLVQLVLNAAWSPIFFGLRRPDLAFIEIIMLWLSIVATIAVFRPISAAAAWLLLPYLLGSLLLRRSTSQFGVSIAGESPKLAGVRTLDAASYTTEPDGRGQAGPGTKTEAQMLEEFKKFIMRGNVVDLAVGVIIGVAFGAIVTSLVSDIIMPIIGAITGGLDFSNYYLPLSTKVEPGLAYADAKKQGAVLGWVNS